MAPTQIVALEDLCVLKLIGEVERYPLAQLVLLPWHLRQKLLSSLPLADICQLETNPRLTCGVDMDAVWGEVCTRFIELISPRDDTPGGAFLVRFERLSHPKDTVMAMIAKFLLISPTGVMATAYGLGLCTPESTTLARGQQAGMQHFLDKWGIIKTLLFCSHLSNNGMNVSASINGMESFVHIKLFPTVTSLQPVRHSVHFNTRLTSITEMSKRFLSVCNSVPKVLKFSQHDGIENLKFKSPESKLILRSILSGVEEFSINRSMPQKVPFCATSLQQVLKAVTDPSTASLRSLRIKGVPFSLKDIIRDVATCCVPVDLSNQVDVTEYSGAQCHDPFIYTNLRKIEFLSCHPEHKEVLNMQRDEPTCLLSTVIPSLLGILHSQSQLEEIHIDHFYDLTEEGVSYTGFENLYSSLADFIQTPHFHSLRIANCHIPVHIAQQLIDIFTLHPSTHPTTLDISECLLDATYSQDRDPRSNEQNHPRISTKYLQFKTLAIPCGGFFSRITLPKVQYKCLRVSSLVDNIVNYIGDLEPQPKELDIHLLSCSPTLEDLGALDKIFAFPHLIKFSVEYLGCGSSPVLSRLASALGNHGSINTLRALSLYITHQTTASSYQQVYEAVFSLPQLPSFSLELKLSGCFYRYHFGRLTEAWKACSKERKLLKLTGLELNDDTVNDFINGGKQVAETVEAFGKFY